ncbi:MAG: laccase domain-containing protein [Deltaproteobacteria bacterium]|nr:laccase domain-containing protein [Deltaproteobacteria bacterium]
MSEGPAPTLGPRPLVLSARVLAGAPRIRHGFSTRAHAGGGSGVAAGVDFDLRQRAEDPAGSTRNRALFTAAMGLAGAPLVTLGQTHEARIFEIDDAAGLPDEPPSGFDAVITDVPRIAIAIGTADCLPVLIADPSRGAVGAVHAGWRSAALGLPALTVRRMGERYGSRPDELVVALGPAIGPCCFEVGEEVISGLAARSPEPERWVVRAARRKPHVDLALATRLALEAEGVRADAIERVAGCTRCDAARFFSFRREGAATGRQLSAIGAVEAGTAMGATSPASSASSTSE